VAGGEGLRVYVRRLTLVLALALLVAGCSKASSPEPAKTSPPEATPPATAQVDALPQGEAPVPDEYRALYAELEEALNTFQDYLAAHWDGATGSTVFGAELLVANGNRGDVLLQPVTMDAVRLYLDRMQGLGIGGVSVEISYPLLRPDFPRSSDYLEFFREVAQEVHRRGLKLLVESGPVFPDPQYSQVQVDFSGLTVETYFQTRSEQLQLIAREVRPDYLAIGGEPATDRPPDRQPHHRANRHDQSDRRSRSTNRRAIRDRPGGSHPRGRYDLLECTPPPTDARSLWPTRLSPPG